MKQVILLFVSSLLIISLLPNVYAENENTVCTVYFTRIGCPVCSKTDPIVLGEWPGKYKNLVIIEYVFNDWTEENGLLLGEYNLEYGTGGGVPLLIFNQTNFRAGIYYPQYGGLDRWKSEMENTIENLKNNSCLLLDGLKSFKELDLNELPKKPKIWANGRLLVRLKKGDVSNEFLKEILFTQNLEEVLKNSNYNIVEIEAEPAPISYGQIDFKKAFKIDDSWILKCNEDIVGFSYQENGTSQENNEGTPSLSLVYYLLIPITLIVIISLFILVKRKVKIKWS